MSEGSRVLAWSYALDDWYGIQAHEGSYKQVGNEYHFNDDTYKKGFLMGA